MYSSVNPYIWTFFCHYFSWKKNHGPSSFLLVLYKPRVHCASATRQDFFSLEKLLDLWHKGSTTAKTKQEEDL